MQTILSNLFRPSRRKIWILISLFLLLLIFLSGPLLFLLIGFGLVSILGGSEQEMQQSFDDAEWVLTPKGKRSYPPSICRYIKNTARNMGFLGRFLRRSTPLKPLLGEIFASARRGRSDTPSLCPAPGLGGNITHLNAIKKGRSSRR